LQPAATDEHGKDLLDNLAPGIYELHFAAKAFKPTVIHAITVQAGEETVVVKPAYPLISTRRFVF